MNKQTWLVENGRIEYLLQKMVKTCTFNPTLRQDLMQEARLHLWRLESRHPGQAISWYLCGCRYHVQHCLARGRSVDSGKRRTGQLEVDDETGIYLEQLEELTTGNETFEEAAVHDLLETLGVSLRPCERIVLLCLAEGANTRLISDRLGMSCPTVAKYRRKIARLALKLDVAAPKRIHRTLLPAPGRSKTRLSFQACSFPPGLRDERAAA
jgi:DNA-directed RNA polymerase specialized sigma24 family protein